MDVTTVPKKNEPQLNGVHLCGSQQEAENYCKRGCIVYDCSTMFSVFKDKDMVANIRKAKEPLVFSTNAGEGSTGLVADVHKFGEVWFNKTAITNLMAHCQVVDQYRVTYDSAVEDAFLVHMSPTQIIKFKRNEHGLYMYTVPEGFRKANQELNKKKQMHASAKKVTILVMDLETVKQRSTRYTAAEVKDAHVA